MTRTVSWSRIAFLTLALIALPKFGFALLAQDCAPLLGTATTWAGTIDFTGTSNLDPGLISHATGRWETACGAAGTSYPDLTVGSTQGGDINVFVNLIEGNSTNQYGTCGSALLYTDSSNGVLVGAEIKLWTHTGTGEPCNHLGDTLTHEIGHVLGLANSGCAGRIMGARQGDNDRVIGSEECMNVDGQWITPPEFEACGDDCRPDSDGPCAI